jgi:hypothetical protein
LLLRCVLTVAGVLLCEGVFAVAVCPGSAVAAAEQVAGVAEFALNCVDWLLQVGAGSCFGVVRICHLVLGCRVLPYSAQLRSVHHVARPSYHCGSSLV